MLTTILFQMARLEGFQGPGIYYDGKVPLFVESETEADPRRRLGGKERRRTGSDSKEEDKEADKYAGLGIGVSGLLAENLACHPFIILRRQCQVSVEARRHHTTPLTLLPVLVNLNRWQGGSVLWKGITPRHL